MSGRLRAAAAGVAFCWLVALYLALVPVESDYGDPRPDNALRCPRPIASALENDTVCSERSRRRVGALVTWLVVTGGVSTAFVASCALAGRRTE